ncbi:MAG: peptide deformylase [Planctomycetota bacterium]
MQAQLSDLYIIHYPDPRLRKVSDPVTDFGERLAALVERMCALMGTAKGVGLAAPQVGINERLIVMNATGEPADLQVFVNPVIREPHGSAEAEEGCLSLPGINVKVRRAQTCRLTAQDLQGRPIELELVDLPARIAQHETDHLNGVLIIDRMGPTDRIATRKTLRALEDNHRSRTTR